VQLPAREAAMLTPGQELRMKLNHSLVSEEIIGRLQSVQPVSGYPDRRDLLIACDLPPEQFAALSKGTIPVTLQWRPPLYTDRFAQAGLVFLILSVVAWFLTLVRAWVRRGGPKAGEAEEVDRVLTQLGLSAREFVAR
jgi:hypothetical protein